MSLTCLLMYPLAALAQLPAPTYGWNLGNTLEPPGGEGSWGPPATQSLIDSVAGAGFNTIRIPCAWDSHANQSNYQIDAAYMARVKQVVDWCYARNLYIVLNCHWDGGWLDANLTESVNPTVNAKMNAYWTQIANTFKNYDNSVDFLTPNNRFVRAIQSIPVMPGIPHHAISGDRGKGVHKDKTRPVMTDGVVR